MNKHCDIGITANDTLPTEQRVFKNIQRLKYDHAANPGEEIKRRMYQPTKNLEQMSAVTEMISLTRTVGKERKQVSADARRRI